MQQPSGLPLPLPFPELEKPVEIVHETGHVHDESCESIPFNPAPLPPYYRKNHETGDITEITKSEYKKSMLAEFTVRNNVNPTCGHSVLIGSEPTHRNCEACWFAYFQIHGEVTKIADEIFQQHSRAEAETIITQIKGKKFWKNFTKFMSTLARFKAATEAAQEQDEQRSTSSPQSSGEPEGGDGASVQAGGTEEGS